MVSARFDNMLYFYPHYDVCNHIKSSKSRKKPFTPTSLRNSGAGEFIRISEASTLNDLLRATMLRIRVINHTIVGYVRYARFSQMQALASLFAYGQPGYRGSRCKATARLLPCEIPASEWKKISLRCSFFGGDTCDTIWIIVTFCPIHAFANVDLWIITLQNIHLQIFIRDFCIKQYILCPAITLSVRLLIIVSVPQKKSIVDSQ